ncbi:hypothetical protein PO124_12135 [Bacillus licheniformis]|nr:hypothetical protein [Bacillus licheniformis]
MFEDERLNRLIYLYTPLYAEDFRSFCSGFQKRLHDAESLVLFQTVCLKMSIEDAPEKFTTTEMRSIRRSRIM